MERSGEIVLLRELHEDANVFHKSLRVTGFMRQMDISQGICRIEHDGHSVFVDTSLVPASSVALESLVQFIGEIKPAREHPFFSGNTSDSDFYMKAKVLRVVDGLDLTLYEESLLARRDFLQNQNRRAVK